jgi:hypothetical protein
MPVMLALALIVLDGSLIGPLILPHFLPVCYRAVLK